MYLVNLKDFKKIKKILFAFSNICVILYIVNDNFIGAMKMIVTRKNCKRKIVTLKCSLKMYNKAIEHGWHILWVGNGFFCIGK